MSYWCHVPFRPSTCSRGCASFRACASRFPRDRFSSVAMLHGSLLCLSLSGSASLSVDTRNSLSLGLPFSGLAIRSKSIFDTLYIFILILSDARSRLYRRRSLQVNIHFSAFFEIYKMCIPLHRSDLKISAKFVKCLLQIFENFAKFMNIL